MTRNEIHIGNWVDNFGSILMIAHIDGIRVILVNEYCHIEYQDYFVLKKALPPKTGFLFQYKMFLIRKKIRKQYLEQQNKPQK